MSAGSDPPAHPSLPWRIASSATMGVSGAIARAFLFGANRTEVDGLDRFLEILDEREDVAGRERGLITVSNHVSVLDDPLIWGILPLSYLFNPDNLRWGLGAYDICFKNRPLSLFFTLGQVIPTHRYAYSPHGGPFQPSITQAIRLLSSPPIQSRPSSPSPSPSSSSPTTDISDPFSSPTTPYYHPSPTSPPFPSPAYHPSRRHAWLHIFPEGKVHQHPTHSLRYFKWGIGRLLLEAEPVPRLVPMWIEGLNDVMHEARRFPRWVPRVANTVHVTIGREVDADELVGDLRHRWRELVERDRSGSRVDGDGDGEGGSYASGSLRESAEAQRLRGECARRVRDEVLKLRRARGWPDEDPKAGSVETWREEGGRREGRMEDGSLVKDV
ncbi:MAG: hypothetical protein M1833_004232 [Piccolia ochrophora]|nr:MAG: hypothetical protein M1833_004232 [Piccolia ochrophora]